MALLDDAIRDHLELKRRRGADPAEIERLEREALGALRRAPEEPISAFDQELADETYVSHEPVEREAVQPPEHEPERRDDPWAVEDPFPGDEPMSGESGRPTASARPASDRGQHPDTETVEYDVEAEQAREAAGEGHGEREDVLEETPEFLQDAPDHDRLWFEQRPPRDFDFGG